ncbi:aspartic peptidase A1 [Mycena floridula]|nr:aspartic peptidase A1 [Mycena floridula]
MQLKLSFSALLAGLLVALEVAAIPTKRDNGMVTLPLKRVPQSSSNVHPSILLGQKLNRSNRRLARMTGREIPSTLELRRSLERRILSVGGPELVRRYNRASFPKSGRSEESSMVKRKIRTGLAAAHTARAGGDDVLASAIASLRKKKGKKGGAAAGGAAGAGGAAAGGSAAGNSTSTTGSTAQIGIPASVTVSDTPATGDSLALDIEDKDVGYLATMQIGTPPRDFLLLMDSGSSDFWVGAENCQSQGDQQGCGNHNFLGPASSSSFVDTNQPFQVTYGTGNVAGDIITDDVTIAGLTLSAHSFGVATSESVDFSDDSVAFDGLVGLAQSTLSNQKVLTPVESLAQQGLITEAITSYKIPRLADNLADGEITFGGLDSSKFDPATLTTLQNVNTQGFWEADVDAATVDGQDTGLTGRTAILDTGTTLAIVPAADAAAIHQLITGSSQDQQGDFLVPCTTTASVAVTFGGQEFAIDPRDLAFQPVDASDPTGDCLSGIQAGDIGGANEWLLGDTFLKNAYFSTDVGKNTVSLAKLV